MNALNLNGLTGKPAIRFIGNDKINELLVDHTLDQLAIMLGFQPRQNGTGNGGAMGNALDDLVLKEGWIVNKRRGKRSENATPTPVQTGISSKFSDALRDAITLDVIHDHPNMLEGEGVISKAFTDFFQGHWNKQPLDAKFVAAFRHVPDSDWKFIGVETPSMKEARVATEAKQRDRILSLSKELQDQGYSVQFVGTGNRGLRCNGVAIANMADFEALAEYFRQGMDCLDHASLFDYSDLGLFIAAHEADLAETARLAEIARQEALDSEANAHLVETLVATTLDDHAAKLADIEAQYQAQLAEKEAAMQAMLARMEALEAAMSKPKTARR